MKRLIAFFLTLSVFSAFGQKIPFINSIDPVRANVNETVTISGSGFPENQANLEVYFGGVQATSIISNSSSVIEVEVPPNASNDFISVTDISSGLTGSSSKKFAIAFGGSDFVANNLQDVVNINTGEQLLFDLCDCDFDGDGLVDIATSSQENNSVRAKRIIYRNTSTLSTINLNNVLEIGNKPSTSIICADINGDGRPEIISTQKNDAGDTGTENVEIFQNNSSPGNISFNNNPTVSFPLPRDAQGNIRSPFQVRAGDLNNDGKKDLIVSNSDQYLHVYLNNSTLSGINFNEPDSIDLNDETIENLGLIELADLNNDNLLDIIYVPNNDGELFLLENSTSNNVLNFDDRLRINPAGTDQFRGIAVGDMDNNGTLDVVLSDAPQGQPGQYAIVRNNTPQNGSFFEFEFFSQLEIQGISPFGLDLGDINGDGLLDIVIAPGQFTNDIIDILINNGNLSFSRQSRPVNFNLRNLQIADLNNDAKPDITFVSNSVSDEIGELSYIVNNNCVNPAITPSIGTYCNGVEFIIEAPEAIGATYNWVVIEDGGTPGSVKSNGENFLDISTFTGDLQVQVTITTSDGCNEVIDNLATFTPNTTTPPNPDIDALGTICVGAELTLTSPTTADEYFWSGPNGFEQTTTTASVTVTDNAQSINSGTYSLIVKNNNGCNSQITTELITVESPPKPIISTTGRLDFCAGTTKTLSTTQFPGFSIQWNDADGPIDGATNATLNVDETGDYTVTLVDDNTTCENTSDPISLSSIARPVSQISTESEICVGVALDIIGQTTSSNANYTLAYEWEFFDPSDNIIGSDNLLATTFTFDTPGEYTATLTSGYVELENCTTDVSQTIMASAPPEGEITTPDGIEKCPSDSVLLQAPANQVSYQWSTGQTGQNIFAKTAQNDNDTTISVTYITDISCEVTAEVTVSNFPNSGLTISTPNPDAVIENNELVLPEGELDIRLDAEGGSNYQWEPAEIFDNPTAASVTAFPKAVSTLITLSGLDVNECNESTSLTLITNSVIGRKSFSPDGNGILDCWEILNTSQLQGCTVYIFDKRGKNIFTGESPFVEDCVWDGTSPGGQEVPEGVYYYVMKCDDSQYDQSGSILLARTGN